MFLGVQQVKVKVDLLELVQSKGEDAKIIRMTSSGKNALYFHIGCYLGKLWVEEPEAYLHVIAADAGLDPLIEHLKGQGVRAVRWVDVRDIPIVKAAPTENDGAKLSRVMEYLLRRGPQRPASHKTLLGSIAALFNPKLTDVEAQALANQLRANGVYEVEGNKVRYGLPD